MTRKLQMILIFIAGALCGLFVVIGYITLSGRQGWHIGGEALILPLFILLIYFGWSLGTEAEDYRQKYERTKSYRRGFRDGIIRANAESRMSDAWLQALKRKESKISENIR